MKRWPLPSLDVRLFLIVLEMTFRYLSVLAQCAAETFTARRSRSVGYTSTRDDHRFLGGAIGALFGKSLGMARNVPPPAEIRGVHILIVDDSPTNREILTAQLNSWGMRCGETSNGPEALLALAAQGKLVNFTNTVPFSSLPDAVAAVGAGTVIGKTVVTLD